MSEGLRPSTLGEILDRTVQLYRRNFWLFAGVAGLPIAVIVAVCALGGVLIAVAAVALRGSDAADAVKVLLIIPFALVAIPVCIAASVFSYAGLTEAAAGTHRGEAISIRGALEKVRPRFWRYLGFILLQGILAAMIPAFIGGIVIFILIGAAAAAGGGTAVALGVLAFILGVATVVAIVWLSLSYSLGMPTCVIENKPAWESLQRSWKLSEGTRGRIVVLYLLIAALAIAASMIASIPTIIILFTAAAHGSNPAQASAAFIVAEIIRAVLDFILQIVLAPVSAIALVLFYYDQRVRKEGFDIEWMMQQAGLTTPAEGFGAAPAASGWAPAAPATPSSPAAEGPGVSAAAPPPDTVEGQ